jgi:hypothetical protein
MPQRLSIWSGIPCIWRRVKMLSRCLTQPIDAVHFQLKHQQVILKIVNSKPQVYRESQKTHKRQHWKRGNQRTDTAQIQEFLHSFSNLEMVVVLRESINHIAQKETLTETPRKRPFNSKRSLFNKWCWNKLTFMGHQNGLKYSPYNFPQN